MAIRVRPLARWLYKRHMRNAKAAQLAADWQTVHASYGAVLKLQPERAAIWVQLGHAAKEMGDLAGAEQAYDTALRLNPDDVDLHVQFGHLHKETGRKEQALQSYRTALSRGSTDVHAIDYIVRTAISLGDSLRSRGQFALAIEAYEEAVAVRPGFDPFMHLGECLEAVGAFEAAEQAYAAALELHPGDPRGLDRLARLARLRDGAPDAAPRSRNEPVSRPVSFWNLPDLEDRSAVTRYRLVHVLQQRRH